MNHQEISFLKSAIRILGYVFLLFSLEAAVGLLVVSEFLGVVEEIGA